MANLEATFKHKQTASEVDTNSRYNSCNILFIMPIIFKAFGYLVDILTKIFHITFLCAHVRVHTHARTQREQAIIHYVSHLLQLAFLQQCYLFCSN